MTYYAWSELKYGAKVEEETGAIIETYSVKPGDKVDAKKLGCSKEDFDRLIANGSVRDYPLPDNMKANDTPKQAMIRNAQELLASAEVGELPRPKPEPKEAPKEEEAE